MTEFGPLDEIDDDSDKEDISLPGVLKGKWTNFVLLYEIKNQRALWRASSFV